MPSHHVVYHIKDKDLFDIFLRGISHKVLLDPIRKDTDLRNTYFKGYRISDHSPDRNALAYAYYTEIKDHENTNLLNFLCNNWVSIHPDLTEEGLQKIGITRSNPNWLPEAHLVFKTNGHIQTARALARSLAIAHSANDILIFISILSHDWADQTALRESVAEEIKLAQNDPSVMREHLQNELNSVNSRQVSLKKIIDETKSQAVVRQTAVASEAKELKEVLDQIEIDLGKSDGELVQTRKEFDLLTERIKEQTQKSASLKQRREKVTSQIEYITNKSKSELEAEQKRLATLEEDFEKGLTQEDLLQDQIRIAEEHIREEMLAAKEKEATDKKVVQSQDSAAVSVSDNTAIPPAPEWTDRFFEEIYEVLAFSSCAILELVWLRFAKLIDITSPAEVPQVKYVDDPIAWRDYYAKSILRKENGWDRGALAWYSWLSTLRPAQQSREVLLDAAISGLYHAARSSDEGVADLLLNRLVELYSGTETINDIPGELSKDAVNILEERGSNPESLRYLGMIQAKLASASPQALSRLYELFPPRPRIIAKRGLVSHLEELSLNEKDPGYEMLDVVCTTISSSTMPLIGSFRSWFKRASLQTIVSDRPTILKVTTKLASLFSKESRRRIELFRDLLGRQLSEAISSNTPESYASLNKRCIDFCDAELHEPEWFSARYLLPLVVEIARCSSNADVEIRKTLRAELGVYLEKGQHPIGSTRREISLGIRLVNRGSAAADNVTLAVMATSNSEPNVDLKNAESRIARIPVGENGISHQITIDVIVPSPVVELEYLLTWNDPSAHERSEIGTLKLTAQRDVDWDRAKISNPFSLRSITEPTRLYGRESVLERLRIGIMGVQSFYLTGQRRVGKSSVARVLYSEFEKSDTYIPVYITLGELTTSSVGAMMYSLQKGIGENVPQPFRRTVLECLPGESDYIREKGAAARTFQRALEQYIPKYKFLCLVDDFDELPQHLYKGPDSEALFLYFRTLIDKGNFSFVLVGSERLPDILRHHGERLNQVKRVNLDYLDNIDGLVQDPMRAYLEFSKESISLIQHYSAGNPYYATQICLRLYEDMILNRDHYVGTGDVQKSVDSIVNEESVSTFQHFWKDGIFEGANDVEGLQQVNASLLIACAALETSGVKPVSRTALLESDFVRKYDSRLVEFQLNNLVDRRVVEGREDSLRLRIPLLGMWLRGIGSAAVQSSFGDRDLQVALTPVPVGVSERDILELAKDLMYQEREVSDIAIKAWIEQFGGRREQELAFALLVRLKQEGYFNAAKIYTTFKRIHSLIIAEQGASGQWAQLIEKRKISNIFVTSIGREGKSGASLLYYYRQANQISASLTGSNEDAAKFLKKTSRPSVVVFIDDFIGSGNTCIENIRAFERLISKAEIEKSGHLLCIAALVGTTIGANAVESVSEHQCRVFLGEELTTKHRAFSPDADIFRTDKDRLEAEAICRSIGEILEPKQPLGYDDGQLLVTFPHRCPNNTLPIFHKVGKSYRGKEWLPLFPR